MPSTYYSLQEARGEQQAERRELHALRRAARQAAAAPCAASAHGLGWELGILGYGGACGDSVTPCGALPSTASTPATRHRQARAAPPTASSEEEWSLSEDGASTE